MITIYMIISVSLLACFAGVLWAAFGPLSRSLSLQSPVRRRRRGFAFMEFMKFPGIIIGRFMKRRSEKKRNLLMAKQQRTILLQLMRMYTVKNKYGSWVHHPIREPCPRCGGQLAWTHRGDFKTGAACKVCTLEAMIDLFDGKKAI